MWKEEVLKPGTGDLNSGISCFGVTASIGKHVSLCQTHSPLVLTMCPGHVRDHPLSKMRTLRVTAFSVCVILPADGWMPGLAIPSTGPLPCCLRKQQGFMWNPTSQGSAARGGWDSSSLWLHREGSNVWPLAAAVWWTLFLSAPTCSFSGSLNL